MNSSYFLQIALEIQRYYQLKSSLFSNNFRFIQISTDEVYGSIEKGRALETDEISSSSPYSASKSSSEQIALSYYKTFKLPVIIPRSSNNYGPFQFPEKLVPLSINNALNEKKINVFGNGLKSYYACSFQRKYINSRINNLIYRDLSAGNNTM